MIPVFFTNSNSQNHWIGAFFYSNARKKPQTVLAFTHKVNAGKLHVPVALSLYVINIMFAGMSITHPDFQHLGLYL